MRHLVKLSIAACMLATPALAACPVPFTAKDAAGTTQNLEAINDANSNCVFPSSTDPCQSNIKTSTPINLTANTRIITGTSLKKTYICSIDIVTAAATNVALVEGTGTVCATSIAGMAGGTTAATGWNFAANGGLAKGSGLGTVYSSATAADDVCILVSAANQISGSVQWVQQ